MKLDILYKETKTGAIQQYDVEAIGNTYVVTQGQVGGAMQEYITVCEPKNVGKKNESSGEEQAITEAIAKHTKKMKGGYTTDPSGTVIVKLPMKVKNYHDQMKNVKFPCYESPKLNGVNTEYRVDEVGELTLYSRGGETYPIPEHQVEDILEVMETLGVDSLNGEMYIHGEHLQDIMAATTKHRELSNHLEFHIFDLPTLDEEYEKRALRLVGMQDRSTVKVVPVGQANSHKELDALHTKYVANGYEGLMVRNASGKYVYGTRSSDVFKYKLAQDAEFKVVGYKLDKHAHAVFEAESEGGNFSVKLKGTAEARLAMAAEAESYIGKHLKVEYETLSKAGKPLKPVGIMFRKVDENGEAIE